MLLAASHDQGEIPSYQMKEHWDHIHNLLRKLGHSTLTFKLLD